MAIPPPGTADTAPSITTQPQSQTVAMGASATFSVVASGSPAPTYQWRKGGVAITGATNASLTLTNVQSTDAGSYTVLVANYIGSVTSAGATLTVTATAPSVTTQPQSQTVTAGSSAAFSVVAAGTAPLSYQWQKGGATIASATAATLTLASVQPSDAGNYTVVVTNTAGSITSATATLTVNATATAPTITTQPQSQTIATGGNATLSVTATGTAPLSYQWQVGDAAIPGATAATLALTNIQAGGNYTVVVSNTAGSVTSSAATITVAAAATVPSITTQPQSQSATAGASVTFTVVASGTAPLSYQWQKGGATISAATTATLTLSNVQNSDAGNYTVVVTNSTGSATSATATLTVSAAATAPTITVQPQSQTVTVGTSFAVSVTASGTPPLSYKWLFMGADVGLPTTSTLTFPGATAAGSLSLSVVVSNGAGSVTSAEAVITITPAVSAPRIATQPAAATINPGGTASLSVAASGAGLSYQWQLNGANLPGATSATLALANVQPAAIGDYTVVVTNSAGSVTSNAAAVSLVPGRLVNLSVLTGIAPGDPLTVGAVIGGKGVKGPLPLLIRGMGPSLTQLGVGGALTDPKLDVFSGPTVVASNDNWGGTAELSAFASLLGAFPFSSATSKDAALSFGPNITAPPTAYTVQITGVGTAAGTALAEVYDGFPSGLIDATTPRLVNMSVLKILSPTGTLTAGFVVGGTTPKQLLIRAIGPTLGLPPFNAATAMPDPKLALFDAKGNTIASNDDWGGDATLTAAFAGAGAFVLPATSRDAALLVTLSPGNYTAQIAASTATGPARGGLALVEVYDMEGGAAPAFSTLPANVSAVSGSTAMLSASAVGAVGYQWQRLPAGSSTWVNLSDGSGFFGTTTASLLASAGAAQTGDQFRVVVTNSAGVTRSSPVTLTVRAAPSAINVTGFVAPQVPPMSLITVGATGLTPEATTYVEFLNPAGALVAQVPPVAVTATNLTVAVPPVFGPDGATLVAGTLSARMVQLVASGTLKSNTFTAANLQAAPASRSQPGALTLSLLQAELDQANSLLATLTGSTLDSANTRAVVGSTIQSLQNWISTVQRAMSSGTSTFTLGTGASVTVTQSDLQAMDNLLTAGLLAMGAGGTSATTQATSEDRPRAAADASSPFQTAAATLGQLAVSGSASNVLGPIATQLAAALASPKATDLPLLIKGNAAALATLSLIMAAQGWTIATPMVALIATPTLGVGALYFALTNGLASFGEASTMVLNQSPNTAMQEAIDRRNGFLDAIAARSNPTAVGNAMLLELNGPATRGFAEVFSGSGDAAGDFLRFSPDIRHGAVGAVEPAPAGSIYPLKATDSARFVTPTDPADPVERLLPPSTRYYPFTPPFSLRAVPLGSSVFTGWRVHAPFYNSAGTYQAAGRDAVIALQMVRGGYFVIATFDLAHTLSTSSNVKSTLAAASDRVRSQADAVPGTVDATPEAVRYLSATGMTAPSYLHAAKVTLTAKENPGYTFSSWNGLDAAKGDTNSGKTATVVMTADQTVTATFSVAAPPTPPAPASLTATAGNQQVALSWSASSGATSYNVKRLTTSGSSYTTISPNQPGTSFTDRGLTNGTTYYYVVTAVNSSGESGNSNQASATPAGSGGGTSTQFDGNYTGFENGRVTTPNGGGYTVAFPVDFTITNGAITSWSDTWLRASSPPSPNDNGTIPSASVSATGAIDVTVRRQTVSSSGTNTTTVHYTGTVTGGNWTMTALVTTPGFDQSGSGTWTAVRR